MLSNKDIQSALKVMDQYAYTGKVDGIIGPQTRAAIKKIMNKRVPASTKWGAPRLLVGIQQQIMKDAGIEVGEVDGLIGPQTRYALEKWQDRLRDIPSTDTTTATPGAPVAKTRWPTQAQVPSFYGTPGQNQTRITPPYQMFLYDTKQKVSGISCHVKVSGSLMRVLENIAKEYTAKEINDLHLNRFFGCLNVRRMRGGQAWSMHSWGIALDFDASRNQLRWGRDKAAFARPEYAKWWQAWEAEGWVSLGRERNYDYMHVQAARL